MSCSCLQFDCAETVNVIISSVIGLILAYFATWSYERFRHRRKIIELLTKFQPLASKIDKFDWQHWNIQNGRIAEQPIDSHMRLEYEKAGEFYYEWNQSADGEISGGGHITFDDHFNGILYYFTKTVVSYKYRNVFYRKIKHLNKDYEAIFVDAGEQGDNYVMMRLIL